MCGRGRSSRRWGPCGGRSRRLQRTLALAARRLVRGRSGPWSLRLGGPVRRGPWRAVLAVAIACGRLSRSGRSKARPLRRGRQTSSHFSSAAARAAGAATASVACGGCASAGCVRRGCLMRACPSTAVPASPLGASPAVAVGASPEPRAATGSAGGRRCASGAARPALGPEAQRLQHVSQLVGGAAEDRHHVRRRLEAAVAGRAFRRRARVGRVGPPGQQRADQVGQPLQHVDAHRARPADVKAGDPIEGIGRRLRRRPAR